MLSQKLYSAARSLWLLGHISLIANYVLSQPTIESSLFSGNSTGYSASNVSTTVDRHLSNLEHMVRQSPRAQSVYNVIVRPPHLRQNLSFERFVPDYEDGDARLESRSLEISNFRINYALLCSEGVPLLGTGDKPRYCSPLATANENSCPSGFWCHIGSTNGTYYCCPKSKLESSLCRLGPASGFGTGRMSRWFFDAKKTRRCQPMTYTGYGGNENNHLTEQQCRRRCEAGEEASTHAATPTPTAAGRVVGARPNYTTPIVTDPCVFAADHGVSKNGQPVTKRWYWMPQGSICMSFDYKGSGGNGNNFATVEECIETCGGGSLDPSNCFLPAQHGNGNHAINRWSYLPELAVCQPFLYTGRGGNANRYPTEEKCRQVCGSVTKNQLPPGMVDALRGHGEKDSKPVVSKQQGNIRTVSSGVKTLPTAPVQLPPTIQARPPVMNPCRNLNGNGKTQQCTNGQQCQSGSFCHPGVLPNQKICCPSMGVNPCSQPKLSGFGSATANRWYYDAQQKRCQPFLYRGTKGNENNFKSPEACTQRCNVNPCGTGMPLAEAGRVQQCSAAKQSSCPTNYYCNPSADTLNSVCCPVKEPACSMPIQRGTGDGGTVQRWGFSAGARLCQSFVYTGQGGNNNNFLNQNDCRVMCQVAINPCGIGVPARVNGQTQQCSSAAGGVCPENHFCHMGTELHTTVCCPKTGAAPCLLSLNTGSGDAAMSRWYFDAASATCRAFTYTGLQGNENNFLSLAHCRRVCPEYDNPCPAGNPPSNAATGQVSFCSATNQRCPAGHWCHLGGTRQTTVCCPFPANPCDMPMFVGIGISQLPRYYYDKMNRRCGVFTYSGKGGNQNNFLGQAECEAACPVLDNPCSSGMPATTSEGNSVLCSVANPAVCPTGHWCHVGAGATTTLCCPGAGDPCRMPMAVGSGTSVLNRWYYNSNTQTCLSFSYTGRGGNQNNFLSLSVCRARCPEFRNPCSTGQPHIGMSGRITRCGASSPNSCPTTYWCHVGATLETSVCCPGAGNPCDLALSVGNGGAGTVGGAALLRYHYDRNTQTCQQFRYSGFGGNQNNFMNQQQCEKRCPVFRNPCSGGVPARDQFNQVRSCSVSALNACPAGFWCHVGANEQSTICCPGAQNPCTEPQIRGTNVVGSSSLLPRFFYNAPTRQCLPFSYTGIGGNQNNFLSRADCERSCSVQPNPCAAGDPAASSTGAYLLCTSTTANVCPAGYWCHVGAQTTSLCCPGAENPCLLPLATGNGNGVLARYYMDPNIRRCSRFTYTGSGGNQNNFLTLQDCQLRCPEFANPCSGGDPAQAPAGGILHCGGGGASTCPANYWCHIGNSRDATVCCPSAGDACLQPLMPGATDGRGVGMTKLTRWYFDQSGRRCLQFGYSGRGGNQNNFLSQTDCERQCPVFRNPCVGGGATPGGQQQMIFCTSNTQHVCPAGHWCHVGVNEQTSVCCPGASDPCQLPRTLGQLQLNGVSVPAGAAPRWYYDSSRRQCLQMNYLGLGGNQNNFLTQQACRQQCPEFLNPCMQGEPYKDAATQLVRFCSFSERPGDCPAGYFCHVGANEQATVCCPGFGDPCTLQMVSGAGTTGVTVPRWYFNRESRVCQQFPYSGIGGNQNNFITQQECQKMCPEFANPCDAGSPLRSVDGHITYCSAQNPNICPTDHYCHVGHTQEATVCCPAATDVCALPVATGRGSGPEMRRWRFNSVGRRCEPFSYSGIGGNANNFLTRQQCIAKCPEQYNPCSVGEPMGACATGCPSNTYCHSGADQMSTVCCQRQASTPCGLPVAVGSGSAQMYRFYFNGQLGACVSFVYGGHGGNENSFGTLDDCRNQCGATVQGASNPCSGGSTPWLGAASRNGGMTPCGMAVGVMPTVCPPHHYCVSGTDHTTTVCCPTPGRLLMTPRQKPADSAAEELIPVAPLVPSSPGQLNIPSSYSSVPDYETEYPAPRTMRKDLQTERKQTPRFCPQGTPLLDVEGRPITCNLQLQSLELSGCPSEDDSYVCNVQQSGEAYCCPNPRSFCLLPRNPGSCKPTGLVTRYGYNPATDTCVPFKFTGCGGNLNNFGGHAQCTNVCCNKGYNLLSLRDAPNEDSSRNRTAPNELDGSAAPSKRKRRGWLDVLKFW